MTAYSKKLKELNDIVTPLLDKRLEILSKATTSTDIIETVNLKEDALQLRNQIVEIVIQEVPDLLNAMASKWSNVFSFDDALSMIYENLLSCVEKYQPIKNCKFTSFFWTANTNLILNKLKGVRAEKRDIRKTDSYDILTSWDSDEDDGAHTIHEFTSDEDLLQSCQDDDIIKRLYASSNDKQKAILDGIYAGYTQAAIAKNLGITGTNVNLHMKQLRAILTKLTE